MSNTEVDEEDGNTMVFCASCGCGNNAEGDDVNKIEAAELLRDEILFKQPETNYPGDCPICLVPLPLDLQKSAKIFTCCCKRVCIGCSHAIAKREIEGRLEHKCPFCRHPPPKDEEEANINYMKRIEANDPFAMREMAVKHHIGGDNKSAYKYLSKAAALGDVVAHCNLSKMYRYGKGVEKDEKMALYHLEEAAIGGHANSRYDLGHFEGINKRYDRASKHYIIAAKLGHDKALEALKLLYRAGDVSKEDLASALRAHQAAVHATKSPMREEAEAFRQMWEAASAARQK